MTKEHQYIEEVGKQIGAPYIWGGKGTHLFSKEQKGLVGSPFIGNEYGRPPLLVFDCSGLMMWALYQVTGYDFRGVLHAQGMREKYQPLQAEALSRPHFRYYGSAEKATHVALAVALVDREWLIIDASGGDSTTTTILAAEKRGACVKLHFERRVDFVGASALPV